MPAGAFASFFKTPLRDVSRFFAVLGLRGDDMREEDVQRFTFVGKAFDISGHTIETTASTVQVQGGSVASAEPIRKPWPEPPR